MFLSFNRVTCESPAVGSVEFFHYSKHVVPHRWILQNPPSVGPIPVPSAKVPSLDPTPTPFINLINPRNHPRARTRVQACSGNLPMGGLHFPFSRAGAGDGRDVERDATGVGLEGTEDLHHLSSALPGPPFVPARAARNI